MFRRARGWLRQVTRRIVAHWLHFVRCAHDVLTRRRVTMRGGWFELVTGGDRTILGGLHRRVTLDVVDGPRGRGRVVAFMDASGERLAPGSN